MALKEQTLLATTTTMNKNQRTSQTGVADYSRHCGEKGKYERTCSKPASLAAHGTKHANEHTIACLRACVLDRHTLDDVLLTAVHDADEALSKLVDTNDIARESRTPHYTTQSRTAAVNREDTAPALCSILDTP